MNFGGCSLPAATPGRVDQVARERGRQREALAAPHPVARLARAARVGLDEAELVDGLVRLLALVAVELIRAEDGALHDGLGPLARGQPVAEHLRGHRAGAEVTRPAHAGRGRPPQNLRGRLGPRAQAGHDDATAVGVSVGDLTRLRRELLGVEHSLELPLRGAIQARQTLGQLRFPDVEADDERVGGDLFEPLGDDVDFHPRVPPLKVSARRIMSRRPWVVSSSASRPISNHCASAASSPATTSSESGYAR